MEDIFTSIPEPLQHENISQQMQLPLEPQFSCFSICELPLGFRARHEISFALTAFSPETLKEEEYPLRSAQETRAQASVYYQPSSVHVAEYPKPVTHVVPLKFSRETYNALLQTRNGLGTLRTKGTWTSLVNGKRYSSSTLSGPRQQFFCRS